MSLRSSQYWVMGIPLTSSMTKNGRPPSVVPASSTRGDVGVVHHRQGLPLGLEPGEHRLGVHPGLDDLDRDGPLHRFGLLGHEDAAHAAFADLLDQLVLPREDRADAGGRIAVIFRLRLGLRGERERLCRCRFQKIAHERSGREHLLDPLPQVVVAGTCPGQVGCPFLGR